jgi:acetolactate synthase-1/2/3 large subunit
LMSIGTGFKDYVMRAVESADLVLTVGYDIGEYPPQKWNPAGDKKIVHIDFNYAEVYAEYTPEVEIVGDISGALWELNRKLQDEKPGFDREWYAPLREKILSDIRSYDLRDGDAFTIPGTLNIIRDILDDCGLLISDVGTHKVWISRNFLTYCPNGCIVSNGLATMGIALPGAIAASLVDPNRQIVTAMGDGGFMMNSQELETAKRIGAAFTAVVFNDNDYGLISWKQQMSRGRSSGTGISNPDFKAYVESFGIESARPSGLAELKDVLKSAITGGKLNVIEVPVDTGVNKQLIEKLDEYWRSGK